MNTETASRVTAHDEHGGVFAQAHPGLPAARDASPSYERALTILILAVCWWTLIEMPVELGMSAGDRSLPALFLARLIVVVVGLAAIVDVRFSRTIFTFLCGISVLAVAPTLPLQFDDSPTCSLILSIECAIKAVFVLFVCAASLCRKTSGRLLIEELSASVPSRRGDRAIMRVFDHATTN